MTNLDDLLPVTKLRMLDFVRLRPGMHVGAMDHRGVHTLFDYVTDAFLSFADGQPLVFTLRHLGDGSFDLVVESPTSIQAGWQALEPKLQYLETFATQILRAMTSSLEVTHLGRRYHFTPFGEAQPWESVPDEGACHMRLRFTLDRSLFQLDHFQEADLRAQLRLFVMIYPGQTVHFQGQHGPGETFHFPDGLQTLYREMVADGRQVVGECNFMGQRNDHDYQLAFGFCTGGAGAVRSWCDTNETVHGGTLLDGTLRGIRQALRRAAHTQGLDVPPLPAKRLYKHLVIVAMTDRRGREFYGPTRTRLHSPDALRDGAALAAELLGARLAREPQLLHTILAILKDSP